MDELLLDGSEEGDAGLDFGLGIGSLNCGRDHGDEPALGGHLRTLNSKFIYHFGENQADTPEWFSKTS